MSEAASVTRVSIFPRPGAILFPGLQLPLPLRLRFWLRITQDTFPYSWLTMKKTFDR